jgi:hypothetical protein
MIGAFQRAVVEFLFKIIAGVGGPVQTGAAEALRVAISCIRKVGASKYELILIAPPILMVAEAPVLSC